MTTGKSFFCRTEVEENTFLISFWPRPVHADLAQSLVAAICISIAAIAGGSAERSVEECLLHKSCWRLILDYCFALHRQKHKILSRLHAQLPIGMKCLAALSAHQLPKSTLTTLAAPSPLTLRATEPNCCWFARIPWWSRPNIIY